MVGMLESVKEFKVRFLIYAALFVSFSLVIGFLKIYDLIKHSSRKKYFAVSLFLILFINTLTLPMSYGLPPAYIYPNATIEAVEDPRLLTESLYSFGFWSRNLDQQSNIVCSWNEGIYIGGYGNLNRKQIITWAYEPYSNTNLTVKWMSTCGVKYLSIDKMLIQYPSLYWGEKIRNQIILEITSIPELNTIYSNGRISLYEINTEKY